MKTKNIKQQFHQLIDEIDNEELLAAFYQMLMENSGNSAENFWDELSPKEKEETINAYDESEEDENLIPHELMKERHKKWFSK